MVENYTDEWPSNYATAGLILLKALDFARSLRCSSWDFAVEIWELRRSGLVNADLRWLICRGWLDHAAEVPGGNSVRIFRPTGRLSLHSNSCFVLTPSGQAAALHLASTSASTPINGESVSKGPGAVSPTIAARPSFGGPAKGVKNGHAHEAQLQTLKPVWDSALNRLMLGELVVKEYRTPAPNQQLILSAFQEEDWPPRIDDPLPPHPELEPKRRLHETIISLNRNQRSRSLRFSGDGNGLGVRWHAVALLQLSH
jgi:hypothetical protein